ncbi:MAG: hypothetical protein H7Y38_11905, partial [Armatimonadetes bacterium]|nr:hypothetical protein [Armatimonadota bacterium]
MQYHISTELGDDENPGTSEKPWRTLARANAHRYAGGDKIRLRAGEIFSGSLSFSPDNVTKDEGEHFTIEAYGSDTELGYPLPDPVIESGTESAITLRNLSRVKVWDIEVRGSGYDTNTGWGVRILNDAPGAERLKHVHV